MVEDNGDSQEFKADPLYLQNLQFINRFEPDIQKLLIVLSTGSIVFSISLLKVFSMLGGGIFCPELVWSWILFCISVVSGVVSLLTRGWWFGNKLLIDRSKKPQGNWFRRITTIWRIVGTATARVQEIAFISAIILLLRFAIKAAKMM